MKRGSIATILCAGMCTFGILQAQEAKATQKKATLDMQEFYMAHACHSCHGLYGEGIGNSPRLAGKKESYLYTRLKELQAGKTRTSYGGVMVSFAKSMDQNQTKAMAHWLSQLKKEEPTEEYDDGEFDVTS